MALDIGFKVCYCGYMMNRWLIELHQVWQVPATYLNRPFSYRIRERFKDLGFKVHPYNSGYYNPNNYHLFYVEHESEQPMTLFMLKHNPAEYGITVRKIG